METQLALAEKTLAEYLRERGYVTGCFGKWHLGGKGFEPRAQGFDVYQPGKPVTTPGPDEGSKGEFGLTAAAAKFMETNRDRPFFLYLAHDSPHIPYAATVESAARFAGAFDPTYAAVIESLDAAVGRLLASLDTLGLRGKTLVIFTSDNGGLHVPESKHTRVTHNTSFRAGKGYLYEGGLRIPLIVRWPGRVAAGRVTDTPVINTDWLPTLLELIGAKVETGFDGVSIVPLLLGKGRMKPRALAWHFPHYTNQGGQPAGAWREGDWKLIEHYEDCRLELFHLGRDPGETRDLGRREPRRARRLQAELARWRRALGAQTNSVNPQFDLAAHRSLYLDFVPSKFDPLHASAAEWQRIAQWRVDMDAAVATAKR
jgi:arylsulfatase A-like enzyme